MAARETTGDSLTASLTDLAGPDPAAQARALYVIRTRHIKQPGGIEYFRARGGLGHVLALLRNPRARRAMDLALSILANCCTEGGCRTQVRQLGGIPPLVTILKSINVDSIMNRTARAMGNLALDPQSARTIHESGAVPHLVDILKTTQDSECLQSIIRAIRNLADTPGHRLSIAQHGAIPPMVERLASTDEALVAASVRALSDITKGCSMECAEQLSLSDGVSKVVALAGHSTKVIHEGALLTLGNLCAQGIVRPTLGNAGGIRCLVEEMKRQTAVPLAYIRALCLCCREAINRVRVREVGGLELLLSLAKDERYLQAHSRIITAFLNFFYDEVALEYLQANGLVPLLVSRLEALVQGCSKPVPADEEEDDERYAASYDFPTEYNRRPDPEQQQQVAESSSFQSLRSWLLSEGYIASPGELSPPWASESGPPELDPRYIVGSNSPTLGLQNDVPAIPEELVRLDSTDPNLGDGMNISVKDPSPSVRIELEAGRERIDHMSNSMGTLDESVSGLGSPAAEAPSQPPPGEPTNSPSMETKMSSNFCRRRRSKSRSVQGNGDCIPNFSEASMSTPVRVQCEERLVQNSKAHLNTPLQQILQASETLSSSFYRQEEVWGPESPLLLLLSRFSQVVDPSSTLVTDASLQGLLSFVARSPEPNHRCLRLLHRLTCNPNCLEAFVRTYGATLIHSQLILGLSQKDITSSLGDLAGEALVDPVQETRWTPRERWFGARMKELGETLLLNLSVQAESAFGIGTLTHFILSGSETDKAACAIALPLICRDKSRMRKLLVEGGGLALIIDKLVTNSDPLFLFNATDSLVTLVASYLHCSEPQQGRRIPDSPTSPLLLTKRARLEPAVCSTTPSCRYQRLIETGQTDLQFRLDCGGMMGAVRRDLLAASDVFQAMLGGEYLESRQDIVPIHGISSPAFSILMHFLHGCHEGDPCLVLEGVCCSLPEDGFENTVLACALSAAGQYLLPGLQSLLEDSVYNLLQLKSLPSVYCFCELYQNRRLQKRCLRFLLHGSHQPLARGRCLSRLVQAATDQKVLVEELQAAVLEVL